MSISGATQLRPLPADGPPTSVSGPRISSVDKNHLTAPTDAGEGGLDKNLNKNLTSTVIRWR